MTLIVNRLGRIIFMRLSEFKSQLSEQAFQIKVAKERVRNLTDEIAQHLLKYFFMPNNESSAHWRKELEAWRGKIVRYNVGKTRSGVNFSIDDMDEMIWEENFGTRRDVDLRLAELVKEGYPMPSRSEIDTDFKAFRNFVLSYVVACLSEKRTPHY